MDGKTLEDRMLDYLYDELTPSERDEYERALPAYPEVASRLRAYRRVRATMHRLADAEAPATVMQDILRQARIHAAGDDATGERGLRGVFGRLATFLMRPAMAAALVFVVVLATGLTLVVSHRDKALLPPAERHAQPVAAPVAKPAELAPAAPEPAAANDPGPATATVTPATAMTETPKTELAGDGALDEAKNGLRRQKEQERQQTAGLVDALTRGAASGKAAGGKVAIAAKAAPHKPSAPRARLGISDGDTASGGYTKLAGEDAEATRERARDWGLGDRTGETGRGELGGVQADAPQAPLSGGATARLDAPEEEAPGRFAPPPSAARPLATASTGEEDATVAEQAAVQGPTPDPSLLPSGRGGAAAPDKVAALEKAPAGAPVAAPTPAAAPAPAAPEDARATLRAEAERATREGRHADAASALQRYIETRPPAEDEARARLELARALRASERSTEALTNYESVLSRFPQYRRNPAVVYETAAIQVRLGQLDEAERNLKTIEGDATYGPRARELLETLYAHRIERETAERRARTASPPPKPAKKAAEPPAAAGQPHVPAEPARPTSE